MPSLTLAGFEGRNIDLLGQSQSVSLDVSNFGQATLLFMTGNTDFPFKNTFIPYIVITSGDGKPFPATCSIVLGVGGSTDWLGGAALDISGQASPVVAWCNQTVAPGTFGLIVYGQGSPFYAVAASSATYAPLATVSAYGFGWG